MFISLLTNIVKCVIISLLRNNYFSFKTPDKEALMTALQPKREKLEHSQKRHVIHKHTAGTITEVRRKGICIQRARSRASGVV
jgi:hypothetical protein